jgi:hypothetical protein
MPGPVNNIGTNQQIRISPLTRAIQDETALKVTKPGSETNKEAFGKDSSNIKDHLTKTKEMLWRAVKYNKTYIETEVSFIKHAIMPTLHYDQVVRGTLVGTDQAMSGDGDMDFEIVPDPEYKSLLNYKGKERPYKLEFGENNKMIIPEKGKELWGKVGAINAEVKIDTYSRLENDVETLRYLLKKGETPHVEFRGVHTFDPFHEGYIELHPVKEIKLLPDPGASSRVPHGGYDSDPMVKILAAPMPKDAKNAEGELLVE